MATRAMAATMSEERIHDLEAAVVSLHERVALLEAAAVRQKDVIEQLAKLLESLHRRLSAIRDAMGPQPPLSTGN